MDGIYPRDVIEKVIAFQGEDMLNAVKNYSQIEISGFGLLYVAKGKVKKRIEKCEKGIQTILSQATEDNVQVTEEKLTYIKNKLDYLKSKLRNNE